MLLAYAQFFSPRPSVRPVNMEAHRDPVVAKVPDLHQVRNPGLAACSPIDPSQYGIFAPAALGIEKEVVLENEVVRITLTSLGGSVKKVVLKKYKDHSNQLLTLLDEQSSSMGFQLFAYGKKLNTNALFFETALPDQSVGETDPITATFSLPLGPGQYIRQIFTLSDTGYTLTHTWEIVGLDAVLGQEPIQFIWHDFIKRAEKDFVACRNKTTVNYYLASHKFDYLKESAETEQEQLLQSPVQWVGIKQRFFTAGIIAREAFVGGHIVTRPTSQSTTTVKEAEVCLTLPNADPQHERRGQFTFYFGPNDYQTLEQVTKGFSKNISLGWPVVRWINLYLIIPVFALLEQYIDSYGIIIILLVILIKFLLLPLSYKSYVAMAKIRVIKPALDVLKAKHGEDMQKIQMEQMSLYREMGINPLSGCVPVLLQMPILLAMFNFFPNAIALRQQAFLWANDLSTYDAIIRLPFSIPAYGSHVSLFTLLMTASTILYTWSNNQLTPVQGPMKVMTYIMPFTFMFVLNGFPAGLSFYYFVSNLVTFGQQNLIKRFVDEEKIKRKLEENKAKNKDRKKSRFQLHLEGAMKAEGKMKKISSKKPRR